MKTPFSASLRPFLSRREMLTRCAGGFGALAATALFHHAPAVNAALGGASAGSPTSTPNRPSTANGLHFPARARNVIFLYMDGGPSQVDTFDPKPSLQALSGQPFPMKMEPTQFNNRGLTLGSPWPFENHGQSGIPVSSLFPHVAQCVDDLAIIRSMTSEFSEHTNANYLIHTGSGLQGRPSMGAWIGYGLGSENSNLPGFVVLNGGLIPPGGLDNFNSGFLPATFQGSVFKPGAQGMANIQPTEAIQGQQERKLALTRALDRGLLARAGRLDQLESAIANAELAHRMQTAVPELMDIRGESDATRDLYGFNAGSPLTRTFAAQCLQARRLVERGVRFIELTCPAGGGDRWDQHSKLRDGHQKNSLAVDQPIAALLKDLKSRGLLDSTLVVWGGEFGRTPFAQGGDGRDHNPFGFTMWMAGGGVRGGVVRGATDEFGYKAVQDVTSIHDLHATILFLLGIDHTRLTFRFSGRDIRLTDVHGEVMHTLLA
jgi:hypothetical protein